MIFDFCYLYADETSHYYGVRLSHILSIVTKEVLFIQQIKCQLERHQRSFFQEMNKREMPYQQCFRRDPLMVENLHLKILIRYEAL